MAKPEKILLFAHVPLSERKRSWATGNKDRKIIRFCNVEKSTALLAKSNYYNAEVSIEIFFYRDFFHASDN